MKKWIALLLASAVCMMSFAALADEAAAGNTDAAAAETETAAEEADDAAEDADDKPFFDFDLEIEELPEGYDYETEERGGSMFATFTSSNTDGLTIYASIAYSDEFEGFTLNEDVTDEQFENMKAILTKEYNDPTIDILSTEYGTKLICVNENDAQNYYCDLITVWKGYIIDISLQKDTPISQDDIDTATKIASEMWIVEE